MTSDERTVAEVRVVGDVAFIVRRLSEARDTIARLTRERDEAREARDMSRDAHIEAAGVLVAVARAEAAEAEVERLDAYIRELKGHQAAAELQVDRHHSRAKAAEAEVDRLRAGLRALVDEWETRNSAPSDFFAGCDTERNACAEDIRAILVGGDK